MFSDARQRIVVLDPGMAQGFGHHYAYNRALQGWLTAKGADVTFLFSRRLPQDMLAEFPGGRAVFDWSPYASPGSPDSAGAFAAELRAVADAKTDADTLVFAHTLDPPSLHGVALWQAALPEARRPRLALNVMLGMTDSAQCRERLGPACGLLRRTGRARLFAGSRRGAHILSELFGAPCAMLPTPLPEEPAGCRTAACPDRPIFGLTGDARRGKNLHILAPAILRYLATGGRGLFRIHLTPTDEALIPALLPLHDLSRDYPEQVEIDWRRLDEKEYYARLGGLTALIIPYSADDYHVCRPSGPVIEAAVMGVPIIACAGGFAEEELLPLGNGSLFMATASARELALALTLFEREKEARKARAAAACPAYAALHGTEAVMRLLC